MASNLIDVNGGRVVNPDPITSVEGYSRFQRYLNNDKPTSQPVVAQPTTPSAPKSSFSSDVAAKNALNNLSQYQQRQSNIVSKPTIASINSALQNAQPTASKTPTYSAPQYYGGSNGGSVYNAEYYNDIYNQLWNAFSEQNKAARDATINAIYGNLKALKGTYGNQIKQITDDYQNLIDENEVRKDRARRSVRENQANRGQLDQGLGRQEALNLNVGYDNITSNLNSAKTKAINEIMSLIAQAEAEAETNRANVENQYNQAELQYKLANL